MKLKNKRAIITGASRGLGLDIAKAFMSEGASIITCARSIPEPQVTPNLMVADISNLSDVQRLVTTTLKRLGGIDILVCNAGIFGPIGLTEKVPWEDWIEAIRINLLGTVLCCREVIPHFKKQKSGKIIILSGGGATKPMPNFSAYAASKAAVVRFGETLAEELQPFNISVNMVAPGAMNTKFLDEILVAGPKAGKFYEAGIKQKEQGGTPLERGVELCVYLASSDSDGISGKLISAVWDNWKNFDKSFLQESEIYTLRRVVSATYD